MALGGWKYAILSVQVDETPQPDEDGMEYVQRLARSKVSAASLQTDAVCLIIAADTSVIDNQVDGKPKILGKPRDADEAVKMLRDLRNRTHQVHTALAILSSQDGTIRSDCCTTHVAMRNYRDDEIEDYVASGDSLDKAGAYAIQHAGFHAVEFLDGCFANVMGLPLCHLTRSLAYFGVIPIVDIPQACQASIGYDCLVFPEILIANIKELSRGN